MGNVQFQALFSCKRPEEGRNNSTNLTLLTLGFPKRNVEKFDDFSLQFSFNIASAVSRSFVVVSNFRGAF